MYKIKQFVNSEVCLKCRGCCRFNSRLWIPCLLKQDKQNLKIQAISAHKNGDNYRCPFLIQDNNHCRVYKLRPLECRLYPYLLNRCGESLDLVAHLACPYLQDNLSSKAFDEYCRDLTRFFKDPEVLSMLKAEWESLRCYPQDEILVIEKDILAKD